MKISKFCDAYNSHNIHVFLQPKWNEQKLFYFYAFHIDKFVQHPKQDDSTTTNYRTKFIRALSERA